MDKKNNPGQKSSPEMTVDTDNNKSKNKDK